jgi:transposase
MDNTTFRFAVLRYHKRKSTLDLFEKAGVEVIFLPPYSPDFNPQEEVWANMKNYIRQYLTDFSGCIRSIVKAFFGKLH